MEEKILDSKVEDLLNQLTTSRSKLETYTKELEALKDNVTSMFNREQTYRSKFVLDEKVKTMSEFIRSLLTLRQEINRTLKDEISIRTNIKNNKTETDEDEIRNMARKVVDLVKEKEIRIANKI